MAVLKTELWGRTLAHGDFDPDQMDTDLFLEALKDLCGHVGIDYLVAPVCKFTNEIVNSENVDEEWANWLFRSPKPADGVVTTNDKEGIVIFNADCPIVALFDENKKRLGVVHAGFRCLVPEKPRKGPAKKSIIKVLFENHGFNPKDKYLRVFFGYGAGPCCYGAEHWPEINDSSIDLPIGCATRGPRKGKRSIDLYALIHRQLLDLGVPNQKIMYNLECTSCAGTFFPKEPRYHSRCRDGDAAGRNAAVVWFEDPDQEQLRY